MKALLVLLLLLAPQVGAPGTGDPRDPLREEWIVGSHAAQLGTVQVVRRPSMDGGEDHWDVVALRAPLTRFLTQLSLKSGDRIEGLNELGRTYLITVDLRNRPLTQVLEYALGSVGLEFTTRQGTITILAPAEERPVEEALDQAAGAWARATRRFPDDPSAPLAYLSQGEIFELRGLRSAALFQYQTLIETFPNSILADDAYMRSGRILQREGRWSEAANQFRDLVKFLHDPAYQAPARLEVARCQVELGDPQSAIYLIDFIDAEYPPVGPVETAGRLLVRASALNALGRYMDALEELREAAPDLDRMATREASKARAVSLEGLQRFADASRAWLVYGRDASPREKETALRHAARLALLAPDQETAVLFICKEAEAIPPRESFDNFKHEAERRLGLREATGPVSTDPTARIAMAEAWLEEGDVDTAAPEFEVLFLTKNTIEDEELAARVCVGWARCEEAQNGLEPAIQILAEARTGFETLVARSLLDLGAASLLEQHGLYDRAVDAYAGKY